MAFPQGVYFRATDNQTDPTDYDCIAGGTTPGVSYPFTTAQGNTVGWEAAPSGGRDRGASGPIELRGVHFTGTTAKNFRFDLPSTGSYNIRAGFGDNSNAQSGMKAQFLDTTTAFATPVASGSSTAINHFIDATGVDLAGSSWSAGNTALANTFSTTIFRVAVGGGSANTAVAALYIESNGGSPDITLAITGDPATGSAGTLGLSSTVGITGGAATAAAGTVAPGISFGLTGVSGTAAAGTVNVGGDKTIAITGNAGTAAVGSLATTRSKGITGASATASCGTVVQSHSLSLTGSQGSGAVGTITVSGGNSSIWTPVPPDGGTWTPDSGSSDIWTPVTPSSNPWVSE